MRKWLVSHLYIRLTGTQNTNGLSHQTDNIYFTQKLDGNDNKNLFLPKMPTLKFNSFSSTFFKIKIHKKVQKVINTTNPWVWFCYLWFLTQFYSHFQLKKSPWTNMGIRNDGVVTFLEVIQRPTGGLCIVIIIASWQFNVRKITI